MELDAHGFTIINVDPTWFVEKPSESMFDGEISTKSFLRNWRIIEMRADDAYRSLTPELVNLSSLLQLARKIETLSLSLSLSLSLLSPCTTNSGTHVQQRRNLINPPSEKSEKIR